MNSTQLYCNSSSLDDLSVLPLSLPCLKVLNGLLHAFLVIANHILVHAGIVGADVLLSAPVRHRTKAQWWVLLCRVLKLHKRNRWAEIKVTDGRCEVKSESLEEKKKKIKQRS